MRHRFASLALVLLTATTSACSDRAQQELRDTARETTEEAGREAADSARRVAEEAEQRLRDHEVLVKDFAFAPAEQTVEVGAEVRWKNEDTVEHTATADNDSFDVPLAPGSDGSFRFTQRGDFPYTCTVHPDQMKGVVRVE